MILTTLRLMTAALQNVTYGVNAQLPSVNRDGSDAQPPAVVTITDETQNTEVAFGRFPQNKAALPALILTLDGDFDLTPEVINDYRQSEVPVIISYVCADIDTASAYTDSYYTIQAAEMCLTHFSLNVNANDRFRNNIQLISTTKMTHTRLFKDINDAFVVGALKVSYMVRDINA